MSVTYGFYNSLNGDRKYDAIQMSSIFDGIIKDGIFMSIGDNLVVKASSGMVLNVGTGRAWFNHTWTLNDSLYPIYWNARPGESYPSDLDGNDITPETVADRIDAVILRIDSSIEMRQNLIGIKKGVPSTVAPEKPELENTENLHEYALAYVRINHGITEISQADIENVVGTSQTPFITGLLETINADALLAQWGAQWNRWYNNETSSGESNWNNWFINQVTNSESDWNNWYGNITTTGEAEWNIWYTQQRAEFDAWFANIKDVLDADTATKLQKQIDDIIPIPEAKLKTMLDRVLGE